MKPLRPSWVRFWHGDDSVKYVPPTLRWEHVEERRRFEARRRCPKGGLTHADLVWMAAHIAAEGARFVQQTSGRPALRNRPKRL